MTEPKISIAMAHMDDNLISGAALYQPKKKRPVWMKWAVTAACLCLMIGVTALLRNKVSNPSDAQPGSFVLSDKTTAKVSYGNHDKATKTVKTDLVYLTEEEMFSRERMYVFRGKVSGLTNLTIDFNGEKEGFCVATIVISKVYQGDISEGEPIRMLLPCPIAESKNKIEDTGVISQLRSGMEGIFMPLVYNEESYREQNGAVLMHTDLAPCGLGDGMRWAFLDTEQGLVFARDAYPTAAQATTLDEIEEYVMEKLKKSK